jgi:hypothetical protein
MGALIAMGAGELLMVAASVVMVRETLERRMLVDVVRALTAAALTVLFVRWLPIDTPFVTIPVCVLLFLGLSFAFGLVDRTDIAALLDGIRGRRSRGQAPAAALDSAPNSPGPSVVGPNAPPAASCLEFGGEASRRKPGI